MKKYTYKCDFNYRETNYTQEGSYLFSWWQNVNQNVNINQWHTSCEKLLKLDQLKPMPCRNNGIEIKIFF